MNNDFKNKLISHLAFSTDLCPINLESGLNNIRFENCFANGKCHECGKEALSQIEIIDRREEDINE